MASSSPEPPCRCHLPTTHVHPLPHPPDPYIRRRPNAATRNYLSRRRSVELQFGNKLVASNSQSIKDDGERIDGHALLLQPPEQRHRRRGYPPPATGPCRSRRRHQPAEFLRERSRRRCCHGGAGCRRAAGQGAVAADVGGVRARAGAGVLEDRQRPPALAGRRADPVLQPGGDEDGPERRVRRGVQRRLQPAHHVWRRAEADDAAGPGQSRPAHLHHQDTRAAARHKLDLLLHQRGRVGRAVHAQVQGPQAMAEQAAELLQPGPGGRAQHGGRLRPGHLPGREHRHHQLRHGRLPRGGGGSVQAGHRERMHGPRLRHVRPAGHRRRRLLPP